MQWDRSNSFSCDQQNFKSEWKLGKGNSGLTDSDVIRQNAGLFGKLAGRARIELVVQWPRIVIADDLNRLARQQLVKAAKNGGVALGWWNLAHVDHERLGRKHENLSSGFR